MPNTIEERIEEILHELTGSKNRRKQNSIASQKREEAAAKINKLLIEARYAELKRASDMQHMNRRAERIDYCSSRMLELNKSLLANLKDGEDGTK